MNDSIASASLTTREGLLHALYEAAELEHNLMCTYLYAAFSLRAGEDEGLRPEEAGAVRRWRRMLLDIAIEEMAHLVAVWNITSALGGTPRFGRGNFPIDPGYLPASVVVKLAPFTPATLQHFVYLERPQGSLEPDGEGFTLDHPYVRGNTQIRLIPQGIDYETVGNFYAALSAGLRDLVAQQGESIAFGGDPALQLSPRETTFADKKPVICLKTALAAFDTIVAQGEGAPNDTANSHFQRFVAIRTEFDALLKRNPAFTPSFPVATNPVLRRPPRPEGRVWLETPEAVAVVDVANAIYALMLRLLGYAYAVPGPSAEKSLAAGLAIGLMRATVPLAERAARLPAGPSNPDCHAGMSFTALRDAAPLPPGPAARRMFIERLTQIAAAAAQLRDSGDVRSRQAADQLAALAKRAEAGFELAARQDGETAAVAATRRPQSGPARAIAGGDHPTSTGADAQAVERIMGTRLEVLYEGQRCIHSRFCVTWGPEVFLANVQGPWIHPDAMDVERVVEIAHACPSGAIRYRRLDGGAEEQAPLVNLASVRESGPYAFRAQLQLDGRPVEYRATLCRCGASKHKPFCDGAHREIGFSATGEPPSQQTEMLPQRGGTLAIDPEPNGPLAVQGNLEIISGTGRVVARLTGARLCRCGGSANKPFCDGTHARIGFVST